MRQLFLASILLLVLAFTSAAAPLRNGCLLDALSAQHQLAAAGYAAKIITTQRTRGHALTVWLIRGQVWAYDASQGSRCISRDARLLEDPLACARLFLGREVPWAVFYPVP